ncbi:MAG: DUF2779 domain-containing protein, partial [Steroidobacteraceae bacterium]
QLDYARDPNYYDARSDSEFLASLAEGGHQVGELARQMFSDGHLIDDLSGEAQARRTAEFLGSPDVTLFEATIRHENLLVRADILEKRGNHVSLIEVKAKGFDPDEDTFLTNQGVHPVRSGWQSYLYDVAFQTYVLRSAHPEFEVTPYLMLLDKTVAVKVDGLNSMLAVNAVGRQVSVTVADELDVKRINPPILKRINVAEEVAKLIDFPLEVMGKPKSFAEFVNWVSGTLSKGESFPVDVGSHCKSCTYYVDPDQVRDDKKSGWTQCMQEQTGAAVRVRRTETVFGLHRASAKAIGALLHEGGFTLAALPESALGEGNESPDAITFDQRRQLQVAEAHGDVVAPVVLTGPLRAAMADWRWPLHFIDFETSCPALPYHSGRTPYDQILFQFSHHVLERDGRLAHRTQCLVASPGVAPSVAVVRALKDALSGDAGTVVHWWTHEATVLKDIRRQIETDAVAQDLVEFIDSLVGTDDREGRLADLGMLVSRTVFYPGTAGGSSIKKVLPAALRHSEALRRGYASPVYGTDAMPSLNFKDWSWVREGDQGILDPYALLKPLFVDPVLQAAVGDAEAHENGDGASFVANGGAAIIAYDQLQRTSLPVGERRRIEQELLRYCELDTLAMVMIYQSLTGHGLGAGP